MRSTSDDPSPDGTDSAAADGRTSRGGAADCTLAELAPGERAVIERIAHDGPLAQRMMQLGLLPGAEVEMIRRAPAGDPIEYRVLGYALSMRADEARAVAVRVRR